MIDYHHSMKLEERLYTSTEVADILGVSLRSVYRYLEEGKLDAAVKTATGRHRFTKQNIENFLYPGTQRVLDTEVVRPAKEHLVDKPVTTSKKSVHVEVESQQNLINQKTVPLEPKSEEIDWLQKFRQFNTPKDGVPAEQPSESSKKDTVVPDMLDISSLSAMPSESRRVSVKEYFYYRADIGGLRDLAQNIDKVARKSLIDYAFTLNAGLSLHKPIKPFSLLHVYVRLQDKEFFEKMLHLIPTDERTAQLCLITFDDDSLYSTRKEMHSLFVVSNSILKEDLKQYGELELARELI